jgi:hypothetical protein
MYEMLTVEFVSKSAVSARSQKAEQRQTFRAYMIQHWYGRYKGFQYIALLTKLVYAVMLLNGSFIA